MNQIKHIFFLIALTVCHGVSLAGDTTSGVTFHFYGAQDCPPCMVFKNRHLEDVEAEGSKLGFNVSTNVIEFTADVPITGVYGKSDSILRLAAKQLQVVYPPIFFITYNDQVVSVHGHKSEEALEAARITATKIMSS